VCVDIVDIVSLGIAWIRNESEKANLRQKLHDLSFFFNDWCLVFLHGSLIVEMIHGY